MAAFRAESRALSMTLPLDILSEAGPEGWPHYFLKRPLLCLLAQLSQGGAGAEAGKLGPCRQGPAVIDICLQGAMDP